MKRKLLSVMAFLCAVMTWGQEDVTSTYLQNADLMSLDGWTFSSTKNNKGKNDYENYKTDGDVPVVEFYHTWGGNAGAAIGTTYEFAATQTVTLPAGEYRIAVNAFYREGNGNGTNEKAYIFAGEEKQYIVGLTSAGVDAYTGSNDLYKAANAFSKGDFSNAFDFTVDTEKEIELGFKGYMDTYCSWCILGPVKLYKYSLDAYKAEYDAVKEQAEALYNTPMEAVILEALKAAVVDDSQFTSSSEYKKATAELQAAVANAETSIAGYNKLGTALDYIENINLTLADDAEERVALNEVVAQVKGAYTEGAVAVDGIAEQIETLNAALRTAVKAQTAVNSDMTLAIINNSFETGNTDGWITIGSSDTGARSNTGNYVTEGIDGDYLFNTWWQGTPIKQTVAGLPNGKYRMDVLVSSDGATIYLLANGEHSEGTETGGSYPSSNVFQDASFEFEVTDGTATIGVVGGANGTAGEHKEYVEEGYWWYKADNFRLTLLEVAAPETVYDLTATAAPVDGSEVEALSVVLTFPIDYVELDENKQFEVSCVNKETGEEFFVGVEYPEGKVFNVWILNAVDMNTFEILSTPGVYELTVPAGVFGDKDWAAGNGGHANPEWTFTYTVISGAGDGISSVVAEGENADVYTLNGVQVLKNADREALKTLKKGIYVVNGKKVILK